MRIASSAPRIQSTPQSATTSAPAAEEPAAPKDEVVSNSGPSFLNVWGKTIAGATVGAGVGFAAGGGGVPGAIIGGATTGIISGVAGVVGAARLDKTEHTGIFGATAAVLGVAGGAYLGAHADGGTMRLATAAVGGIAGAILGFSSSVADWTDPNPKRG